MAINDNTSYELFGYQVKDLATKIKSKAEAASLAPVATSGLYSDLTGKPTIPTVYNGTLTIQQNGTTVDTFTANSSTNKTVNIETITAETVAPAQQVGAITASMIDWSTIRVTLFSGTPTKSTVALSESVSNFSYLIIVFRREDNASSRNSLVIPASATDAQLLTSAADGGTFTLYANRIAISGTQITRSTGSAVAFNSIGQVGFGASNEIKIEQVIGIK